MNNPMKDRRDALDLAIIALENYRDEELVWLYDPNEKQEWVDRINQAIQILTRMKDEGPLL